ncbi:MAG TPA: hypothetical protein VKX17_06365 [Planctomycetota bacterium]|nr:hypothetical protein [Planctomycetota bacterium]
MQRSTLIVALLVFGLAVRIGAEDAAEWEAHGIDALKLSQTSSDAVISAALFLGKAYEAYEAAGDQAKAVEVNSFIYYCRKKMTLQQMDAFLKEHETSSPALVKRLKELEKEALPASDAQAFYDRAEAYAAAYPSEHYLIAVRFFEVADRFRGSDLSLKAQERSLQAQQLALADIQQKAESPPAPHAVPPLTSAVTQPPPESGKKAAVPAVADLKKSEKQIKDLFKEKYQKNAPEDRAALARELLSNARGTDNDPAGKFVLLRESKDIAALAGDAATALQAIEAMDKDFSVDALQLKTDALAKAASYATQPESRLAVATAYLAEIDTLEAADKYDLAAKFFAAADTAARRVSDPAASSALVQRVKDARDQQAEFSKVKKAVETLAANPDEGAANLIVGRFYCLVKDDWTRGLPMLQKSNDPKIKDAADSDLNVQSTAESKAHAADAWWALAEKEKSRPAQLRMQLRAKRYYEGAILAPAQGLLLAKLWSKMKDMPATSDADAPKNGGKLLDRTFADKFLVASHGYRNDMFTNSTIVAGNGGKKPIVHQENQMALADDLWGKKNVLCIHPPSEKTPDTLDMSAITNNTQGILTLYFHNAPTGGCEVEIVKDDKVEKTVKVGGEVWKSEKIVFQRQPVKLVQHATGWWREWAFITYEIELH